jgi:fermentation-respiration switch protein FrsA (DUF1100 family)
MRTLLATGALVVLAVSMPSLSQRLVASMVFHPTPGADLEPGDLRIDGSEVWLDTEDGVRVHAFFLPGAPDRDRAILYLHGNAGNASHRLPIAAELARLGSDVLVLDYRGYGRSQGTPSEAGVYRDARAALAHLTGARGLVERRVVLFGESLGGAVAIDLAADRALAGVIVSSTFTSLADMGWSMAGPFGRWLAGDGFDSLAKVASLRAPLLAFHGDRDELVSIELGRRLFERAPPPKEFHVIRGAGHNDTVDVGGADYFAAIARFLDEVAPAEDPGPVSGISGPGSGGPGAR